MKVLLHCCCAPCSIECVKALETQGLEPGLYWYNPNIQPQEEYRSRKESLLAFGEENKLPLLIEDAPGMDFSAKDCGLCYRLRLEKTARLAAEKGFNAFSTSLLISPYQNHELIKQTAEELAAELGIEFLYRDFRPLFRQGQNQARQAGYYMQKYCGCAASKES
ncbi:MAG: epoxyqueuosine reductase QueH [Treponema sp.]|nr:epoxyqueuosine reductase QueH [Treponema sp.]